MAQAKRSTTTRVTSKFKQPAAMKRLSTSLDNAQKALAELSKGGGREVSKGAKDIYADLRKFVADAGRESTRVGKALQREFDQAQKQLAKSAKSAKATTTSRSTAARSTAARSTTGRSTAKRSTAKRSTASGAKSTRSTASRSTSSSRSTASSGRSTARRASSGSGTTKRSTTSKRGTSKS